MRYHELTPGNDDRNTRANISAIQELFLKLNSQDEVGIIATYQTAKSLLHSSDSSEEELHLYEVKDAAKARMLTLVASSTEESERRRLTDTFRAVLNERWFAIELWNRWEYEKRAKRRALFWSKIFSMFKERSGSTKES